MNTPYDQLIGSRVLTEEDLTDCDYCSKAIDLNSRSYVWVEGLIYCIEHSNPKVVDIQNDD